MFVYRQGYPDWKKSGYPVESMDNIIMNVAIPKVSAADLKARLDKGEEITVVDLRDISDRGGGIIKGAIWIPLEDLMAEHKRIPKANPVCLVCLHGKQSPIAGQYLVKQGYAKVFMLENGMKSGWLAANLPTE